MKGEFLCESFLFSGRHRHEEDVEDTHVKTVHSDSTEFEGTIKVKAMRCEVRIFSFPELFPRRGERGDGARVRIVCGTRPSREMEECTIKWVGVSPVSSSIPIIIIIINVVVINVSIIMIIIVVVVVIVSIIIVVIMIVIMLMLELTGSVRREWCISVCQGSGSCQPSGHQRLQTSRCCLQREPSH